MQEIWKDIPNYEGLYEASNTGKIRNAYGHILKQQTRKNGYLQVALCKNGKPKVVKVHRIIAQTFIPIRETSAIVNHKDENKTNNQVENLEWCTHIQNVNYGTAIERAANHRDYAEIGNKHKKPVAQLGKDGKLIKIWDSAKSAGLAVKTTPSFITACCKGKERSAKGFVWNYMGENTNIAI